MKKKKIDLSKSSGDIFNNSASGITFKYKNTAKQKQSRKEFFQGEAYSYDIELEEKPVLNKKNKNDIGFKPSTKQTVDKDKIKKLKEKFHLEQEDEIKEEKEEEIKDDSKQNSGTTTPPSRVRKNIYTEKNVKKTKVIFDDSEEQIENKIIEEDKLNNSLDDKNEEEENKEKKTYKNNKNKDKYTHKKIDIENDNEIDYTQKESKGIKSAGGDIGKFKFNNKKKKPHKWNEEEYQKLISESKNYEPLKEFYVNKYILTNDQLENIKQIPELYDKYMEFISLKKKQDQMQRDVLITNILKCLKNIYKNKTYYYNFKVSSLFDEQSIIKLDYKSNEKTAYFDLFISFISIYVEEFQNAIELSSVHEQKKLMIPLYALFYIFSSQAFFSDVVKLIQIYYNKYLIYKIIPIYVKNNEEYRYRINSRQTIWKQFEDTYLYYKNNKKLYLTNKNGEHELNLKKIEKFSEKIKEGVKSSCEEITGKIFEKHKKLNEFNINDENITLTNKNISAPSSLFNQISEDMEFKLKMNLYKYKMKQLKIKKNFMLIEAGYQKNDYNNYVKNKIFKQSVFYMNTCDVINDFLDNSE